MADAQSELEQFASRLAELRPSGSSFRQGSADRDRLMYEAGRQSVLQQPVSPRGWVSHPAWAAAACGLLIISVWQFVSGLTSPRVSVVERVVYVDRAEAEQSAVPPAPTSDARPLDDPPEEGERAPQVVSGLGEAYARYVQSRDRMLEAGVDAVPPISTSGGSSSAPKTLLQWRMLLSERPALATSSHVDMF